jgi:putative transposase
MSRKRRTFSPEFKAKVALEALKEVEPIHVIASRHEVLPVQVSQWKKELARRLPEVFASAAQSTRDEVAEAERQKELYARIGQQQIEIDWLKKKLGPWL